MYVCIQTRMLCICYLCLHIIIDLTGKNNVKREYMNQSKTKQILCSQIIKWQITLLLLMLVVSQYLILVCAKLEWDEVSLALVNVTKRDMCWLPPYVQFDPYPNTHQQYLVKEFNFLCLIYFLSLLFATCTERNCWF